MSHTDSRERDHIDGGTPLCSLAGRSLLYGIDADVRYSDDAL